MKETRILMGMPITVEIVDKASTKSDLNSIFEYFDYIDQKFSTYKKTSEITQINNGKIKIDTYSDDMKTVFNLSEKTKQETHGYFDIYRGGKVDPSGVVKGWAIGNAAAMLQKKGFKNYYVDAGGDVQVSGRNAKGNIWTVGIRNPFNQDEIVKVIKLNNAAIATSGTYIRGQHVYNPKDSKPLVDIVSLTVVGPNIYDADRFTTAAFAMGKNGINFIENLASFEGYQIDKNGLATYTSGFEKYVLKQ